MLFTGIQILLSDRAHQWIMRIGICEKGRDGKEELRNGQGWTPVILEQVQADLPLAIYVTVVDACPENHLWGLERIVWSETDIQEEYPAGVR